MKVWRSLFVFAVFLSTLIVPVGAKAQEEIPPFQSSSASSMIVGDVYRDNAEETCYYTGVLPLDGNAVQSGFGWIENQVYRNYGRADSTFDPPLGWIQVSESGSAREGIASKMEVLGVFGSFGLSGLDRIFRVQFPAGQVTIAEFAPSGGNWQSMTWVVPVLPFGQRVTVLAQGGSGKIAGVGNLAIGRCYAKSSSPLPPVVYEEFEDSTAIFESVEAGVVQLDNTQQECRTVMLPLLRGPEVVTTASADEALRSSRSPWGIIDGCVSSYVPNPVATLMCLNPIRVNLVKDDSNQGWAFEMRCNQNPWFGPVYLGNVQALPSGGIGLPGLIGTVGVAVAAYAVPALEGPANKVWYYIRSRTGIRNQGEIEFSSENEALDWAYSQSVVPAAMSADPISVARMMHIDVEDLDSEMLSSIRYYVDPTSISDDLQVYKSSAMGGVLPPEGLVAYVQYATGDGSGEITGVVSFYISTGRPSIPITGPKGWLEMTTEEAEARFPLPPYDPTKIPEEIHRDPPNVPVDPGRKALRSAEHVTLYNWVAIFLGNFKRPPWDWCGYRKDTETSGSCACVKYPLGYIDTLGKVYKGLIAIVNGNSTVFGVKPPSSSSFSPYSESARPDQNGFKDPEIWRTIGPDDFNLCSPEQQRQLGLNLAP